MFEPQTDQIVRGVRAGTFVVLGARTMHGERGAQLKAVNPLDFSECGRGELWLPLSALVPLNDQRFVAGHA